MVRLERTKANSDIKRAVNALNGDIAHLKTITGDWARWDDTYRFVADLNDEYIRLNLIDEEFAALHINMMLFFNKSGDLVFGKAFDLLNGRQTPVPGYAETLFNSVDAAVGQKDTDDGIAGISESPDGPVLFSSWPILSSEFKGPQRGRLVIARYLDQAEVEKLSERVDLPLTSKTFDDPALPGDFEDAKRRLEGEQVFSQAINDEAMASFALLNDIHGRPALMIKAETPRDIHAQGHASVSYFMSALFVSGAVITAVTWLLIDRLVAARLARLSASLRGIRSSGDHSARVAVEGSDEIAELAEEVNGMLGSLERSGEEFNQAVLGSLVSQVAVLDAAGTVISVNGAWLESARESPDDAVPRCPVGANYIAECLAASHRLPEAGVVCEGIKKVLEGSLASYSREYAGGAVSGRTWFLMNVTPLAGGRRRGVVVSHMDITERKLAEERLMASLREKETLLREVHHRVKNNMQIISSLLRLQSVGLSDREAIEKFRESQDRIKAMALIHENLYSSKELSRIMMKDYVTHLLHYLAVSHGADPKKVELKTDIAAVEFDIDTAIPCGLLINELAGNALKHAFPGDSRGEIKISLRPAESGQGFELTVKDNGVGLPGGLDIGNSSSLGLKLVSSLAEQLDGEVEITGVRGTEAKIRFKEAKYEKRI